MRGRFPPCSRIIVDHPPSDAGDEPPGGEEPARVERRLDAAHERNALSRIAPHVELGLHLRRGALDHERAAARLEAGSERRDETGNGASHRGATSLAITPSAASAAASTERAPITTASSHAGRGRTLNVASTITPSVPSAPTWSFGRS